MRKITGNLILSTPADVLAAADVVSVDGELYIRAEGASLPALTRVDGGLNISAEGASLPCFGTIIAHETWSLIRLHSTGLYVAGCRGPWTRDQALAHWIGRSDERAVLFTAALMAE